MKTVLELINTLYKNNVKLSTDGERLHIKAGKGKITPEIANRIKENKQEIIEFLISASEIKQTEAISPADRRIPLPLSVSQQRMMVAHKLNDGETSFNTVFAYRITGALQVRAIEKAIDTIILRHEAIRTTFKEAGGKIFQYINEHEEYKLPVETQKCQVDEEKEQIIHDRIKEDAELAFDLENGPLYRFKLIQFSNNENVLLINLHHIITDGWSSSIFYKELAELYKSHTTDSEAFLPQLQIQYADYAAWQQEQLKDKMLDKRYKFWKSYLHEAEPSKLPVRRVPVKQETNKAGLTSFVITSETFEAIKHYCSSNNTTLYDVLLSTYKLLLHYYSGQKCILVGSSVANRNRSEIENLIGLFANIMMLRTDLTSDLSFSQLVKKVSEIKSQVTQNQEFPIEEYLKDFDIKRNKENSSLIQTTFALHNESTGGLTLEGLQVQSVQKEQYIAEVELGLSFFEKDNQLHGGFIYDSKLFDEKTIAIIEKEYINLLSVVVAQPQKALSELLLISGTHSSILRYNKKQETYDLVLQNSNLTESQLLVWYGEKLHPDSCFYNNAFTNYINEKIDVELFQKAFQMLVNTNDAFRTVINQINGIPWQEVVPEMVYNLKIYDFTTEPNAKQKIKDLLEREAQKPFDISKRMFDSFLIKKSEEQYEWYINIHHLISDTGSLGLIVEYTKQYYKNLQNNQPDVDLNIPQFRSYVQYEREYRESEQYQKAKQFWEEKLKDDYEPVKFYGKTAIKDRSEFERRPFQLGLERSNALTELVTKTELFKNTKGASLFTIFYSALAIYLYRVCGKKTICIGVPFHNRRSKSFKRTIGYFVQNVPVKFEISPGDTVETLIEKISKTLFEAMRYGQYVIKNPIQKPKYDIVINYQIATSIYFDEKVMVPALLHWVNENESFALQVSDFSMSGNLLLDFDFHEDAFTEETKKLCMNHYIRILDSILENPMQEIGMLGLLPDKEQKIVEQHNDTRRRIREEDIFINKFYRQLNANTDAIAVEYKNEKLSYKELNDKANQLANYLIELGIEPETRVGILCERSLEMMVAFIAIFKAGAAFVPLDPANPDNRLVYMINNAGAKLVLTSRNLENRLKEIAALSESDIQYIFLKEKLEILTNRKVPVVNIRPDNLAYVLYTSGSTGMPKGVMITQKGLANYLNWAAEAYEVENGCGAPVHSSIAFDATITSLFTPLIAGKKTILIPEKDEIETLANMLCDDNIYSLIKVTPSHLEMLSRLLDGKTIKNAANYFVIGGEALFENTLDFWRKAAPNTRFINEYGPTESVVGCCVYDATTKTSNNAAVPIGTPVSNTKLYILDEELQTVPFGVTGELYINSIGLAKGYINMPDITQERFIQSPFNPGERIYRTGDLCRYLPCGNIEFIGRTDSQVKVKGYRIELGEIENTLLLMDEIQEAVVIKRNDLNEGNSLTAYLIKNKSYDEIERRELSALLQKQIPEYMVPSHFIYMDQFPLTTNGKVEVKLLPKPGKNQSHEKYAAPRNTTEEILVEIWKSVLGVEAVGIYDNFFELGGDSILSIQVVSKARQKGIKLTPRQIFSHTTIAEISNVVEIVETINTEQGEVTGVVPLTPVQKWFLEKNNKNINHYNQSFLLKTDSDADSKILEQALQELLKHHDILRARFKQYNTRWTQEISPYQKISILKEVDISGLPDKEIKQQVEAYCHQAQTTLDILEGPAFRAVYFNNGHKDGYLLMVIHHLLVDGVSWRILLNDLVMVYEQVQQNKPIQLPPKSTSFKQWAEKSSDFAKSDEAENQLNYWTSQFKTDLVKIQTVYDYLKEENTMSANQSVIKKLDKKSTQVLLQDISQVYNTQINDILLSALALTISQGAMNKQVLIDLEGHGREELIPNTDLSNTVGWFTTQFPVVLNVKNSIGKTLKSVKETLRNIPDKGIGYGLLKYCGNQEVRQVVQELPKAEICFNYLGQFDGTGEQSFLKGHAKGFVNKNYGDHIKRTELLYVGCVVVEERLLVSWNYCNKFFKAATIESYSKSFIQNLENIINHCLEKNEFEYTPDDFQDIDLTEKEINTIVSEAKNFSSSRIESIYPLSPSQLGMYYETVAGLTSGIHIEQSNFAWNQELDMDVFMQIWQQLQSRYAVLRTCFVSNELDKPLQVVFKESGVPIEILDLSKSGKEKQTCLEQFLERDRQSAFDMDKAPLMRLTVIKLDNKNYQIVWTCHHILIDGWGLPLLVNDMLTIYKSLKLKNQAVLPIVKPYRDYINWVQRQSLSKAKEYWKTRLKEIYNPIPIGKHYNVGQIESGELITSLNEDKLQSINQFAKTQHVTLNTIIQSVWSLVLNIYTQKHKVVFGATVSGRPPAIEGVNNMLGLFINTVPVVITVEKDIPVFQWLKQIQLQQVEQKDFEYCSTGQIHQWSAVPNTIPLYESLLIYENYPVNTDVANAEDSPINAGKSRFLGAQTKHALTLMVFPGKELTVKFIYKNNRFTHQEIQQVSQLFFRFLKELPNAPEQLLGDLLKSTQIEREQQFTGQSIRQGAYDIVYPVTKTQIRLANIWQKLFGIEQVSIKQDFFELGGHSLILVQLLEALRHEFGKRIPLNLIIQNPTIEAMAWKIEQENYIELSHTHEYIDLSSEAVLPEDIRPQNQITESKEKRNILLTGATGFIGAHLIEELLQQTNATIYCLVRADNMEKAQQRIMKSQQSYQLKNYKNFGRVVPVLGDLSQRQLGLSQSDYEFIQEHIDLLLHNGAWVNYAVPFSASKNTNIRGTEEILRLASRGKTKPVHYISTLGVFSAGGQWDEDSSIDNQQHRFTGGYASTKWVAEKLVLIARERGLPCNIYRLGLVTGHSQTGVCRHDDFFHRILLGSASIGSFPKELINSDIDLTPIDYVVNSIIHLAIKQPDYSRNYHLVNSELISYKQYIQQMIDSGVNIKIESYRNWLEKAEIHDVQNNDSLLKLVYPLLEQYRKEVEDDHRDRKNNNVKESMKHNSKTIEILSKAGIHCPKPNEVLLKTYIEYLMERDVLTVK